MKNFRIFIISAVAIYSSVALAGTPTTTMQCVSSDKHASLTGTPGDEYFDLKIKIDNANIRYTNNCDDTSCKQSENYGNLVIVDALFNKVFTISFANNENNNRGIFYALPETVKYTKTQRGYNASYKGIYWGDDPRSNEPFKEFVKAPGIEFNCIQKNEL